MYDLYSFSKYKMRKLLYYLDSGYRRLHKRVLKLRYPQNSIREAEINGYRLLVQTQDSIGTEILCFHNYERSNTDFIIKNIKSDWVCFDIGANIGYYSMLLAKYAPKGRIFSFEPNPIAFNLLNLNRYINDFENIYTQNSAVSDRDGIQSFTLSSDSGFSSFQNTERVKSLSNTTVNTTTLY